MSESGAQAIAVVGDLGNGQEGPAGVPYAQIEETDRRQIVAPGSLLSQRTAGSGG